MGLSLLNAARGRSRRGGRAHKSQKKLSIFAGKLSGLLRIGVR